MVYLDAVAENQDWELRRHRKGINRMRRMKR